MPFFQQVRPTTALNLSRSSRHRVALRDYLGSQFPLLREPHPACDWVLVQLGLLEWVLVVVIASTEASERG